MMEHYWLVQVIQNSSLEDCGSFQGTLLQLRVECLTQLKKRDLIHLSLVSQAGPSKADRGYRYSQEILKIFLKVCEVPGQY